MSDYAIEVNALTRRFGNVAALQDITFTVDYGHIAAIIGPNGSGKSTLMRVLLGLLRPSTGEVHVLGLEPFAQANLLRSRVGALLEYRKDPSSLSALESLQFAGLPGRHATDPENDWTGASDTDSAKHSAEGNAREKPAPSTSTQGNTQGRMALPRQTAAARASRIDDLLYRFDLWPHRHHRVIDLSRSEREKLALVATLVPQPFLLLLDEPLAALDMDHRIQSLETLREIARQDQATVLFTTNALQDAEAIADQGIILSEGRVTAAAPIESLLHAPALPILEITGRGFTDEVVALLQRRQGIASVHRQPHSLLIQFNQAGDTAPLVNLLVESGVDIDEVHKRRWDLRTRYRRLLYPSTA